MFLFTLLLAAMLATAGTIDMYISFYTDHKNASEDTRFTEIYLLLKSFLACFLWATYFANYLNFFEK